MSTLEGGSSSFKPKTLPERLRPIWENGIVETGKPLLLIVRVAIIFIAFLLVDLLLVWMISLLLDDVSKDSLLHLYGGNLLSGLKVFSAIVTIVNFGMYLTFELYAHGKDLLKASKEIGKKGPEEIS